MLTFLKRLLWDEAAFERWGRATLVALGQAIASGAIPTGIEGGGKLGWAISFVGLLISGGTKTSTTP